MSFDFFSLPRTTLPVKSIFTPLLVYMVKVWFVKIVVPGLILFPQMEFIVLQMIYQEHVQKSSFQELQCYNFWDAIIFKKCRFYIVKLVTPKQILAAKDGIKVWQGTKTETWKFNKSSDGELQRFNLWDNYVSILIYCRFINC